MSIDQRLRWQGLPILLLSITLIMAALLTNRIQGVKQHNLDVAIEGARNIFRMIVLTREWNASLNGIYTFVSQKNQPNPYLKHPQRDLELADHRKLTMLNPAYMTRQIAELAENDDKLSLRLHITSFNPIRPENQADTWENGALKRFEQGALEFSSLEFEKNQQLLRYMAPLYVKQSCLNCHAKQGYKLGDLRGGISVSLPFQPTEQIIQNEIRATMLNYGITYALVILLSFTLIELLARRWRALNDNIEALQNTRNELVENEKMASLGRLVAGFAHELNTPVGIAVASITDGDETINTLTALIAKDEVTEQELTQQLQYLQESHQLARANLHRAAELVQRFKRTSIDRGSQQKRTYQLLELIQDVLISMRNILKRTQINISIHCPENLWLFGTPGLLEQVLTNLITNSLTHGFDQGKSPGQILISAERIQGQQLHLNYQDNGIGMSDTVLKNAFEPFFTTQRANGGSGLGLYVTYNIITQQMSGTIHLTSTPGNGTSFEIKCPIEKEPLVEN